MKRSACSGLVKVAYPSTMGNPFGYGEPIKYPAEGAIIEDGVIYGRKNQQYIMHQSN